METDNTKREIYCTGCKRILGTEVEDGQCLKMGDAHFFTEVRFSCKCWKPKTWKPAEIEDSEMNTEAKMMLYYLGRDREWRENAKKRKREKELAAEENN